jgi:3-oxoadipate enol-lactonase
MSLHHRIDGDGDGDRVLVLAGSLGSTLDMWNPQLAVLTERFRVVRFDHPGHGGSPLLDVRSVDAIVAEVVALLDELGLDRVSFCGLSLGGAVGMRLALDRPELLDRLVLCCTSMRFATPDFWEERTRAVREGGVEAIADAVLERWFTPGFRDVRRYRDMLVSTAPEGYARCCEALRDWDVRGRLGGVRTSTLVIAAADDPSTPPDGLEAIAAEMPAARYVLIDDARHLVNAERPAEFNAALASFL